MSTILDSLKERLELAKARLLTAQERYQAAGAELQSATNDYNIWSAAINVEMREEEKRLAVSHEKQISTNLAESESHPIDVSSITIEDNSESPSAGNGVSKTDLVREMLRKHAAGITAAGLWTELQDRISSRAYLYSILKRLRDKDEVFIRRKKYLLKPKLLEEKTGMEMQIMH